MGLKQKMFDCKSQNYSSSNICYSYHGFQVMAFFVRPDKDIKHRKYWNWYRHYVGSSWKIGYGFVLAAVILMSIILEVLKGKHLARFP